MVTPNVITTQASIGRRREARLRVQLGARLITLDGTASAVMADISGTGARLHAAGLPLRPGEEAVLQWCGREAFGVVVWAEGGQCGMCFYDQIAGPDLAEIRRINDRRGEPTAAEAVRDAARAFVQGQVRL